MNFIKTRTYRQRAVLNLDNVDYIVEDDEDTSTLLVYFNNREDPLPIQSSFPSIENSIFDIIFDMTN